MEEEGLRIRATQPNSTKTGPHTVDEGNRSQRYLPVKTDSRSKVETQMTVAWVRCLSALVSCCVTMQTCVSIVFRSDMAYFFVMCVCICVCEARVCVFVCELWWWVVFVCVFERCLWVVCGERLRLHVYVYVLCMCVCV